MKYGVWFKNTDGEKLVFESESMYECHRYTVVETERSTDKGKPTYRIGLINEAS